MGRRVQRTQPDLAADPGSPENTICLETSPSPKPCGIPERARPFVATRWMAEVRRNEGSAFPAMSFCVAAMTPLLPAGSAACRTAPGQRPIPDKAVLPAPEIRG